MNKLSDLPTFSSVSRSRLHSLYSDFSPQRHSNPAGFQSNVDWWRRTLLRILATAAQPSSPDVLILHADNALIDGLRCDELGVGRPLGIGSVVTELSASNTLIPLSTFHSSTQSIYYAGSVAFRVASYLIGKPIWWALEQLTLTGDGGSETNRWQRVQGDYAVIPLLEQAAKAVLDHYQSQSHLSLSDSLYSPDSFRAEFSSKALPGVNLSSSDMEVLLKFLERDRRRIVTDKDVIKFINLESETENERVVTQVDRGVLEMKSAVARLQDQIEDLHQKIEDRTARIKEQLHQKRKEMALTYLRSRKQLEDLLSKRLRSLETIQSTLIQVESAAGDIEIMKAYETSTMTLRNLLSHPLLQRDRIDATMDAVAEASADHAEIEQAIRLGGEVAATAGGVTFDEEELQRELQGLVAEKEKEEAEMREKQILDDALKEREREEERQRREAEKHREQAEVERKWPSVEGEKETSGPDDRERRWEERWLAAQAEKDAQRQRDKEAEYDRRARWEDDAQQAI